MMRSLLPVLGLMAYIAAAAVIGGDGRCRGCGDTSYPGPRKTCKVMPGDPAWPKQATWDRLNATVGGRLIATVPLGAVCHQGGFGMVSYDADRCANLKATWDLPATYFQGTADPMQPFYQNTSCSPFYDLDQPCKLGSYAVYSIAVSGPKDVVAGLKFARDHNVRLVIRNTGHDFLGKSTGAGSLALLTGNLKSNQVIPAYRGSRDYTGPAMKIGAGATGGEAALIAANAGYRIVSGDCPTVGIAGGYTTGGGHGLLNSVYGMAADNALEWEVVTVDGRHLVATPTQNKELYWALSGGGGGTYAVILSLTTKLHPEGHVGAATLIFNRTSSPSNESYTEAVSLFWQALPDMVDQGVTVLYQISDGQLWLQNATAPDKTADELLGFLRPLLRQLDDLGIPYEVASWTSPSYAEHYSHTNVPLPFGLYPTTQLFNSRLISRATSESGERSKSLTAAMEKAIASDSAAGFFFGCSAMNVKGVPHPDNGVAPMWRQAIAICMTISLYDWNIPEETMVARRAHLAKVVTPMIEAETADSGAYLNEADPLVYPPGELRWQKEFYGSNYDRLRRTKRKWDPESLLYAHTAVGAEDFFQDGESRLYRVH